ncbi:MAG: ribonuclease III [Microthrixaceae bacterium]
MPSTTSSPDSEPAPRHSTGLSGTLGYSFGDPALLQLALRHRSWCSENGGADSNERLEFLGDSVLGLVITDELFRRYPDAPEGVLARRRSELVNTVMLAEVARELDLGSEVRLGKGEESTGGAEKASILADALEAVLGAVYIDGGLESARRLTAKLFSDRMDDVAAAEFTTDHKSRLQELAAHRYSQLPRYSLRGSGPEHEKTFTAEVALDGVVLGSGAGRTKKEAEQQAAAVAHARLLSDTAENAEDATAPVGGTEHDGESRDSAAPNGDEDA